MCGDRWAGPRLLADWTRGCRIAWAETCSGCRVDPALILGWPAGKASSGLGFDCCCADRQVLDAALPCKKNQKEEGPAGASPVAAPMLKSDSY